MSQIGITPSQAYSDRACSELDLGACQGSTRTSLLLDSYEIEPRRHAGATRTGDPTRATTIAPLPEAHAYSRPHLRKNSLWSSADLVVPAGAGQSVAGTGA